MLIDDIRESTTTFIPQSVFSYGRSFDTALDAAKIEVDQWFIHLDPITFTGTTPDNAISAPLSLGFLKQDTPDSEFDQAQNLEITQSIEEIHDEALTLAVRWLNNFLDTYTYGTATYTAIPIVRVKNVMSGILLNVTFIYKLPC